MAQVFDGLEERGVERRNCRVLTIRATTHGTVRAPAKRQGWSKIATRTAVQKVVHQCCGFEYTVVIDRPQIPKNIGFSDPSPHSKDGLVQFFFSFNT